MEELRGLLVRVAMRKKQQRKENQRLAMCAGKRPYSTKADADRASRRKGVMPYRCPICHKFHVGGTESSRRFRLSQRKRHAELQ